MSKSILTTTKEMLGIQPDATYFDSQLIVCINSAFSVLNQLGVGPKDGFYIEDDTKTWDDYTTDVNMRMLQMYIAVKTRLLWDPPTSSNLLEALKQEVAEYEFRMNVHCDGKEET